MTEFFQSLTVREMLLWTTAFAIGLIAGWLGFVMSAYITGVFAAIFVTFRYVTPTIGERRTTRQ